MSDKINPTLLEVHGLDNAEQVFFYENDFYPLSNFSAFEVMWDGRRFATSEHAYHYEKFKRTVYLIAHEIQVATSAHEAFKIAEKYSKHRRPDWDDVKLIIMKQILHAKTRQHEYVRHKLLATGDRQLIENSWRDDFWGWGPNKDGKNMLGKLWMEVRSELRSRMRAPHPEDIPANSPAHYLDPGEWQWYCPRDECRWMAPRCTSGGARMGCEKCGHQLRCAQVRRDGTKEDHSYER